MSIDVGEFNYLAIVVVVVVQAAAGALWYSPMIFGNPWMAALGTTQEEIRARGGQAWAIAVAVLASIVGTLVIASFVQTSGADSVGAGVVVGLMAGIGLVATAVGVHYVFEARPLKLFLINAGAPVLNLLIAGAVLGAWQ
jgi:uncharacterized membrane protein (DUF485 family)